MLCYKLAFVSCLNGLYFCCGDCWKNTFWSRWILFIYFFAVPQVATRENSIKRNVMVTGQRSRRQLTVGCQTAVGLTCVRVCVREGSGIGQGMRGVGGGGRGYKDDVKEEQSEEKRSGREEDL